MTGFPTCRGSASISHHSPPSGPGGYSLSNGFRWIAFCTSPISTLGHTTAVVLTNKCFLNSSRNALQSDLRPLKEKSSPQRTNLTNSVSNTDANFPSDTPIRFITSSTYQNAAPASLSIHCIQQLVDLAINGHEHAPASDEWRCAREMSNNISTSSSPSTCDLGPVIIKLSCNENASHGGSQRTSLPCLPH